MDIQAVIISALVGIISAPVMAGLTVTIPAGQSLPECWNVVSGQSWRRLSTVSVLCGSIAGLIGGALGLSAELPGYLWLAVVGVALAIIDLDCHRLPNRLVFPTYAVGLSWLAVVAVFHHDLDRFERAIVCLAVVYGVFYLIAVISPASMGFGDVKLAGVLGLYLGWLSWSHVLLGLTLAFVVGGLAVLPLVVSGRLKMRASVPFGPALLVGTVLSILLGNAALGAS